VRIAVINGPNLNLLGTREPEIYGTATLADIEKSLRGIAADIGAEISFSQHNGEGDLIDAIQACRGNADGIVINAAAYSHTSLAIRDALTGISTPFVEVHLTNVFARDAARHKSMIADAAVGFVCGFGAASYELALRGLVGKLSNG
jgi:3-dehydroquinate dehydratase-2